MTHIDIKDFMKINIRVGTIKDVKPFESARNPSYQLWVDFGADIGIKKTSAQITINYQTSDLIGRQIIGVINFPPKQIANFMSEFLILGVPDDNGDIILMQPSADVPNGGRLH